MKLELDVNANIWDWTAYYAALSRAAEFQLTPVVQPTAPLSSILHQPPLTISNGSVHRMQGESVKPHRGLCSKSFVPDQTSTTCRFYLCYQIQPLLANCTVIIRRIEPCRIASFTRLMTAQR